MKFQTAKDRLKKMAKGKYHTVRYELNETMEGNLDTRCWLYIGDAYGVKDAAGNTFRECFDQLEKRIEEIPEIDG